jgi:uncharacterized protein (TIGR02246 family)
MAGTQQGEAMMRDWRLAGVALALTLGVAPTTFAADAKAPGAAKGGDKAQIAALEKSFAAAVNAKDVAKVMSVYAKDGLFVYDVAPPRAYVGWEAYKKDWEGFFKEAFPGALKFTISDLVIETQGDMAFSHSIQTIEAPGNTLPKLVVRLTDVYRKSGGHWRIVHEHVSVPVDVTTGKADLLSRRLPQERRPLADRARARLRACGRDDRQGGPALRALGYMLNWGKGNSMP